MVYKSTSLPRLYYRVSNKRGILIEKLRQLERNSLNLVQVEAKSNFLPNMPRP